MTESGVLPVDHALLALVSRMLRPVRLVADPAFIGLDRIPCERPLLFVGNHTIYGVFDVPFLMHELYTRRGIALRGLGDHIHFRVPFWRDFIARGGAVDGTRENCAALMRAGESILVYPGGAREVAKRRDEKYKLVWKERLGFVRMAVAHGCTIVPFAGVGVEDAFDVVYDADDVLNSPLGAVLRALRVSEDVLLPIARGLGPTPLPRPVRLYFHFAEPIPTRHLVGREDDDAVCRELRDRVRGAIEEGVRGLQELRRHDPRRALLPRLATAAWTLLGGTRP